MTIRPILWRRHFETLRRTELAAEYMCVRRWVVFGVFRQQEKLSGCNYVGYTSDSKSMYGYAINFDPWVITREQAVLVINKHLGPSVEAVPCLVLTETQQECHRSWRIITFPRWINLRLTKTGLWQIPLRVVKCNWIFFHTMKDRMSQKIVLTLTKFTWPFRLRWLPSKLTFG